MDQKKIFNSRESQENRIYSAEQINIPATLPSILKDYAKAAIRTQPYDLLSWTAAYFGALANGEFPPVKERLEYPPFVHPSGITPRFLKILLNQFCHDEDSQQLELMIERKPRKKCVKFESLLKDWRGMALKDTTLYLIVMAGRFLDSSEDSRVFTLDLYRFLAIACGLLGNNLYETMIYICELLTKEPEGGSARICFRIFMNLYQYLADLDCSGSQSITPLVVQTESAMGLEQGEVSLDLTAHSSSPSSSSSLSAIPSPRYAGARETRPARCQSSDISNEDTDGEEYYCSSEDALERSKKPDDFENTSKPESTNVSKIVEETSTKESYSGRILTRQETSVSGGDGEMNGSIKPRPKSTSENSIHDNKKRLELEVEESTGERLASGETEVTKVQEVRRDVEIHSKAEKVKPAAVGGEMKTIVQPQQNLTSSASSLRDDTSNIMSTKSYKDVEKEAGMSETATGQMNINREFEHIDETSDNRSSQIIREAGGADINPNDSVASNDLNESVRSDVGGSTVQQDVDDRHAEKIDEIQNENDKKSVQNILALENEGPVTSDEDDSTESEKAVSRHDEKKKIRGKGGNTARKEKGIERGRGIRVTPKDHEGEQSFDENENIDGEEFEDMVKYERIGLENILDGICECLEMTKDTRSLKNANESSRPEESSPIRPLDPVAEFFESMRVTECPTGSYILPELPGIGPPVSPETVTAVALWLTECSRRQEGQVGPRNLRHFMCPSLDGHFRYEACIRSKLS